jgi:hypothetical protein
MLLKEAANISKKGGKKLFCLMARKKENQSVKGRKGALLCTTRNRPFVVYDCMNTRVAS